VDLVWWTDHDWRVAAHDHRQAVHFDAATELENDMAWTWTQRIEGVLATAASAFGDGPHSPTIPGGRCGYPPVAPPLPAGAGGPEAAAVARRRSAVDPVSG